MIQSMECRSSTPANAGPVSVLFILWQDAQRLVKITFSSIGSLARAPAVARNNPAASVIMALTFLFQFFSSITQQAYLHTGTRACCIMLLVGDKNRLCDFLEQDICMTPFQKHGQFASPISSYYNEYILFRLEVSQQFVRHISFYYFKAYWWITILQPAGEFLFFFLAPFCIFIYVENSNGFFFKLGNR